ncbi:MAG TPA: FHA domain-containing protein [Azospirillaceae bacterium]|nr:FHA domain-containing protein [Azospirillaceae bacterium]
MQVLVRYVTRRRGNPINRDETVETELLRIGRGTDNALHLPDLRVAFHHAEVRATEEGVHLRAMGDSPVRVNGNIVREATLGEADDIEVGPYKLKLLPPGEGYALGVSAELVAPLGDDEQRVRAAARVGLAKALPGKRPVAWALALAGLVFFLVLPIFSFTIQPTRTASAPPMQTDVLMKGHPVSFDMVWDSGEMSTPHKFLSDNCTACHKQPFVMVQDQTCVACHQTIEHHADPASVKLAALTEQRCASCHKEHEGHLPIVQSDERLCTTCHTDLKHEMPETRLLDAKAFTLEGHPQFRPSVVADGATGKVERAALGGEQPLREESNLKFPHGRHLQPNGVKGPNGFEKLDCASCHATQPGGKLFQPVRFEENCASCHTLGFDPKVPARTVPHGPAKDVQAVVRDHFNSVALAGGYDDLTAPAVVRRRPGEPLLPEQRAQALQWAAVKSEEAMERLFSKAVCGGCHVPVKNEGVPAAPAAKDGIVPAAMTTAAAPAAPAAPMRWDILPVRVATTFMPKASFDHQGHTSMACESCHAASKSNVATDLLLPGIENCVACHGPQNATNKVPSECVSCHVFHQPHLPAMRPAQAAKAPTQVSEQ